VEGVPAGTWSSPWFVLTPPSHPCPSTHPALAPTPAGEGSDGGEAEDDAGSAGRKLSKRQLAAARLKAERAAKRQKQLEEEAEEEEAEAMLTGAGGKSDAAALEEFNAAYKQLSLHSLHTPGRVEAFEIDASHVNGVKFTCLEMDPPLPLVQVRACGQHAAGLGP
jgi:hypothetical protein